MELDEILVIRVAARAAFLALEDFLTTDEQRTAYHHAHKHLDKADSYILPLLVEVAGHVIEPFDGTDKPPHP